MNIFATYPAAREHAWDVRQRMRQLAALQRQRFHAPAGFGRRQFANPPSMAPAAPRWWHDGGKTEGQELRLGNAQHKRATRAFRLAQHWTGARG